MLLVSLFSGCASTSRIPRAVLNAPYCVSRDGGLQYRLPVGWFDASADSQAVGHAIWLMRADYGATIVVDQVSLDRGARADIAGERLLQLAQLLISLTAGDRGAVLIEAPVLIPLNGTMTCRYALLASEGRDTLQVTLLDTGTRVYTLTALRSGKEREGGTNLAVVMEKFIAALRW
jgi:hypothetical protein